MRAFFSWLFSLPTPDFVVFIWAICLLVVALAYVAREVYRARYHSDRPVPIKTDVGVLILLSSTGPLFIWEMRRFGVTRARRRVKRLLAVGYVQREGAPGGVLVALTPSGQARARAGQ